MERGLKRIRILQKKKNTMKKEVKMRTDIDEEQSLETGVYINEWYIQLPLSLIRLFLFSSIVS